MEVKKKNNYSISSDYVKLKSTDKTSTKDNLRINEGFIHDQAIQKTGTAQEEKTSTKKK